MRKKEIIKRVTELEEKISNLQNYCKEVMDTCKSVMNINNDVYVAKVDPNPQRTEKDQKERAEKEQRETIDKLNGVYSWDWNDFDNNGRSDA